MENLIERKTEELIAAIKQSDSYLSYRDSLRKITMQPEVKKRIDDFRISTFRMYTEGDASNIFEETDRIEQENQELRKIPEVNQFLEAEIALCRIIKNAEDSINKAIDIQIPR